MKLKFAIGTRRSSSTAACVTRALSISRIAATGGSVPCREHIQGEACVTKPRSPTAAVTVSQAITVRNVRHAVCIAPGVTQANLIEHACTALDCNTYSRCDNFELFDNLNAYCASNTNQVQRTWRTAGHEHQSMHCDHYASLQAHEAHDDVR